MPGTCENAKFLSLSIKKFVSENKYCLRHLVILTSLLALGKPSQAQFTESIFYDTVSKVSREGVVNGGYGEGIYIYLTGGSFSNQQPIPSVTKMDTAGNVVWTAIDPKLTGLLDSKPDINLSYGTTSQLVKDGNLLFTASQNNQIWCLNDSSGAMIWNTPIPGDLVLKMVNYSPTELLILTGRYGVQYSILNKQTGVITYSRQLLSGSFYAYSAEMLVDNNHNILVAWGDTCYKYYDKGLTQLAWASSLPSIYYRSIKKIIQDSGQYIFSGLNNVRAVDSGTGNTIWYDHIGVGYIPRVQSGGDGNPKKMVLKDSMIYVSWVSPVVGGLDFRRGFTLTSINKNNGSIRYNVAYDFDGIPPDSSLPISHEELDWPMDFSMDPNGDLYLTGSYDRSAGPENPGNWGIMKINGTTGDKIYEATITQDSLNRCTASQGLFISCQCGKLFAAGNLAKVYSTGSDTRPVLVSFAGGNTYQEQFRISPFYTLRYPSTLAGMDPVGSSNMALLKMVGRSATVELRTAYNQPIWGTTFSSPAKFAIPQMIRNLHDTAIAVSYYLFKEEPVTHIMIGDPDSVVFVRLDTLGHVTYIQQLPPVPSDSIAPEPVQIYTDAFNRTNFIYRRRIYNNYTSQYMPVYYSYMMDGGQINWSSLTGDALAAEESLLGIRRSVALHYEADTMVSFRTPQGIRSNGNFCSTWQSPNGYAGFYLKNILRFQMVYGSINCDTAGQVIFGRDSSGQMLAARYNFHLQQPLAWNNVQSSGSFYTGDTSSTHVFAIGRLQTGELHISKIEKATGLGKWNFDKAPRSQAALIPMDYRYDQLNQQFTVGGYQLDSSYGQTRSSYFYISLDSNGTLTRDVTRSGDHFGYTRINTINNLQTGSHFYGGRLSNSQFGIVGFYNADCFGNSIIPAVSITTPRDTVCSGATVTFSATPAAGGLQPQYQWKINGVNTGTGADTLIVNTLRNNDQISVNMLSNADCLQTGTATSNVFNITVLDTTYPTIQISGKTTLSLDSSSLILSVLSDTAKNARYQWQDSTQLHNWQNIPNAEGSTIEYSPGASGDELRCILKNNLLCTPSPTSASNVLQFHLDSAQTNSAGGGIGHGVRYYPNPVNNMLIVDSFKTSDLWQTLQIVSINGAIIQTIPLAQDQNMIVVDVSFLTKGVYLAILRGTRYKPLYLKFVKM